MRPIKFRVWDKKLNKMYYDFGICGKAYLDKEYKSIYNKEMPIYHKISCNSINDGIQMVQNHLGILMQFTGLLDKNQKEIYEGDILNEGLLVKWCEKTAQFIVDNGDSLAFAIFLCDQKDNVCFPDDYEKNRITVIGNIYETPELLEKS